MRKAYAGVISKRVGAWSTLTCAPRALRPLLKRNAIWSKAMARINGKNGNMDDA